MAERRGECQNSAMLILPVSPSSLLVRTDFTSDDVWEQVCAEALRENEDGFCAYAVPISDPAFTGAAWEVVRSAVPVNDHGASVLFIVDSVTIDDKDHPILVVGLSSDLGESPFRCIPAELWSVDNNLNISNMDWAEFAAAVDEDGVFRGFPA